MWGSIQELKQVPPEHRNTQAKLRATLTEIIDRLRSSAVWVTRVARCCDSAPRRLQWVLNNDGEEIRGKAWGKQDVAPKSAGDQG